MNKLVLLLFIARAVFAQEKPERLEYVIRDFRTEGGATLPEAHVVYGTYGHLNAAKDNAVLLPSHYMANMRGYEWLMGKDKALDSSQLFLITSELFGNGSSSSPSNTPEPFHGPRFPVMTIRDNVEAVHKLLPLVRARIRRGDRLSVSGPGIVTAVIRLEQHDAEVIAKEIQDAVQATPVHLGIRGREVRVAVAYSVLTFLAKKGGVTVSKPLIREALTTD